LFKERVDVVVCDGFVGNIVLKTCGKSGRGDVFDAKRELVAQSQTTKSALISRKTPFKPSAAHGFRRSMARAAARFQRHGVQGAWFGARTRRCQRTARDGDASSITSTKSSPAKLRMPMKSWPPREFPFLLPHEPKFKNPRAKLIF